MRKAVDLDVGGGGLVVLTGDQASPADSTGKRFQRPPVGVSGIRPESVGHSSMQPDGCRSPRPSAGDGSRSRRFATASSSVSTSTTSGTSVS